MSWRVSCESTTSLDEKTGEPRRWHFTGLTEEQAREVVAAQEGPCCFGCCPAGSVRVSVQQEERESSDG